MSSATSLRNGTVGTNKFYWIFNLILIPLKGSGSLTINELRHIEWNYLEVKEKENILPQSGP